MADQRVREVQQWLNDTFPSYFKFSDDGSEMGIYPIEPDGITGSRTMKALVMAVQIHYNLTPVDGIWGNGTSAACATISAGVTDSVILKIAQGGFYCKGYEAGGFDGIWGNGLATIISTFKEDLGIIGNSTMEPQVFKALLTTDPTVLVNSGDVQIRNVQKFLNRNYYSLYKAKLGYIPTGGIFERKTSKALIYAFQKEINTTADGALGPKTFESMPEIEEGCTNQNLVKILQACLICNGYATDFDGVYDTALAAKITEFQQFMCLNIDPTVMLGSVNRRTWGALLWSKGDSDRTPNACDCRTKIIEASTANALYANGFRYIGRYLTNVEPDGYDKRMTPEEVSILLDAGLKIFPIFQESASTPVPTDFTETQGKEDADRAINAAYRLGIEPGTTLYFAIDCDMMDDDITNYAIPYFTGIMTQFRLSKDYYSVGVYGARNTCTRLMSADLAERCFVSNMSTGYSGNLGYKMPEDWSLWCKAFPNNLEYNMPSQLMKRYAVDFWENKDRTVYYVNIETGVEEKLSNDINTLERLLEEEWHLKIECKSEDDIEILASELAEWTEYALRRSPYSKEYCDFSSTKHVADYLRFEAVSDETESVFISLSYLYHYELRLTEEPFAEIIEKRLRQCLSF